MGTTIIPEGLTLPIALLLTDGDATKYPQAEMYSSAGVSLGVVNLTHLASGLYTPTVPTVMTSDDYVIAVYIVYDDAGHTVESTSVLRSSEVFAKATYVELTSTVDGAITVGTALARAHAMAANKIVKTLGNQYAYRNAADTGDLFTLQDNDSERTPL